MRLNTAKSMKLARRVKGQFGTWEAVRQAARVENGVYIIERSAADGGENPKERLQPVGA
jgi:hypothetical protein